jgi:hypothetical protein
VQQHGVRSFQVQSGCAQTIPSKQLGDRGAWSRAAAARTRLTDCRPGGLHYYLLRLQPLQQPLLPRCLWPLTSPPRSSKISASVNASFVSRSQQCTAAPRLSLHILLSPLHILSHCPLAAASGHPPPMPPAPLPCPVCPLPCCSPSSVSCPVLCLQPILSVPVRCCSLARPICSPIPPPSPAVLADGMPVPPVPCHACAPNAICLPLSLRRCLSAARCHSSGWAKCGGVTAIALKSPCPATCPYLRVP